MTKRAISALLFAALVGASSCSIIEATENADTPGSESSGERSNTSANGGSAENSDEATSEAPPLEALPPAAPEIPDLEQPLWVGSTLELEVVATITEPVAMTNRSGFDHLYVGERSGIVQLIQRSFTKKGVERISLSRTAALDISAQISTEGEGGLLGLAFSTDGRFLFVSYTNLEGDLVVDEYEAGRGSRADINSRRQLMLIPQPFANHNGGQLALGPDGYLYVGVGDGGGSYDPDSNAQDVSTLLGSILRIDTFAAGIYPYSNPLGNPFVNETDARGEIYLYGVRNPWRFSFDQATGDLWVADIGQDTSEEINYFAAADGAGLGANLGWGSLEGYLQVGDEPLPEDFEVPLHVYGHSDDRCSVIGGFVYRGSTTPFLDGAYIFGDYCSGEIFGLHHVDNVANAWPLNISLAGESVAKNQLSSFGQGPDGEVYVLLLSGEVARIVPGTIEAEG